SRPVWPELDHWIDPVWLDDATLVATTDDQGRGSVWIGAPEDPAPRRLAGGPEQELAFSSASVAGGEVIASASGIAVAPHPVRIDPATGAVRALPNPADPVDLPGTLTEVTASAEDGTALRAWLRLPEGEGPHPLGLLERVDLPLGPRAVRRGRLRGAAAGSGDLHRLRPGDDRPRPAPAGRQAVHRHHGADRPGRRSRGHRRRAHRLRRRLLRRL